MVKSSKDGSAQKEYSKKLFWKYAANLQKSTHADASFQ